MASRTKTFFPPSKARTPIPISWKQLMEKEYGSINNLFDVLKTFN